LVLACEYAFNGSLLSEKNSSQKRNGDKIDFACSHLFNKTRHTASASTVESLPCVPQDTGFAANTTGSVRGFKLGDLRLTPSNDS
jgi:hypothetical protein